MEVYGSYLPPEIALQGKTNRVLEATEERVVALNVIERCETFGTSASCKLLIRNKGLQRSIHVVIDAALRAMYYNYLHIDLYQRSEKLQQLNEILERQTEEIQEAYKDIVEEKQKEESDRLNKQTEEAQRLGYYNLLEKKEEIERNMEISENTAAQEEEELRIFEWE
ncbi:hypothetical protein KIN20_006913 [Parelaphostrongylus tenuis]|uniref:Uncharacterized protein n=1 Tax=Parelaphostrongylus tenuis TaxID=148309 RepID=A0AAD5QJM1_PARTN|nr:hypothetical protein KIN20_006913 [Parelaphostrongylus tenuis]